MGILSRLFSKQDKAALTALEDHLLQILNRSNADFVSIVGVEGKVKGLDIVYQLRENGSVTQKDMKRINAKLVELYRRVHELSIYDHEDTFDSLEYRHKQINLCLFPIPGVSKFIVTASPKHSNRVLKEMTQIRVKLYQLTEGRDDF